LQLIKVLAYSNRSTYHKILFKVSATNKASLFLNSRNLLINQNIYSTFGGLMQCSEFMFPIHIFELIITVWE